MGLGEVGYIFVELNFLLVLGCLLIFDGCIFGDNFIDSLIL